MTAFCDSVRARQPLIGTFVKTPGIHGVEVLGGAGLDFVVLDAEHAPLALPDIDHMVLAARSARLPCVVRVPGQAYGFASAVLDAGTSGVMFPHVCDAGTAHAAAAAAKFSLGERGVSPSPRAAGYGASSLRDYVAAADASSTVWCQIEDAAALPRLDEIAAVAAVDCLFVGPADLALSLGTHDARDARVRDAIRTVSACAARHGIAAGIHVGDVDEIDALLAMGITVFVCASDQGLLRRQALRLPAALAAADKTRKVKEAGVTQA